MKTIAITLKVKGGQVRELLTDVVCLGDAILKLKQLYPGARLSHITAVEECGDDGVYITRKQTPEDIKRQKKGATMNTVAGMVLIWAGVHVPHDANIFNTPILPIPEHDTFNPGVC